MTREENIQRLGELRAELEADAIKYNELMQDGNASDAVKLDNEMTEKVNEYTSIVKGMCFEDCKNTEDPMLTAVTTLNYMTVAVKDNKVEDSALPVREIVDRLKAIDLRALHKYCGGIGANQNWEHIAQKMNFLLTAQVCKDLGIDLKEVNDSYEMSEIARAFDMGKNPTSNTGLLKTLQTVISAMLGEEYKATSHDVKYLTWVYAKKKNSKALTVTCSRHSNFIAYIAEICHRIVTGASYEVLYQQKKESK